MENPKPTLKVRIKEDTALKQFGLKIGDELPSCDCPEQYKDRFAGAMWVFSPVRNEPVRLMEREYQLV